MRLNLGSGSQPRVPGFVNVDLVALDQVDVVHDLDVHPWPWDDASVKAIVAQDVFEHLADPIGFMVECHRVLESGGELLMKVPHWQHQDAYTDPTHRRFCTEYTWDYWIKGTVLFERHNAAYSRGEYCAFALDKRAVANGSIFIQLHKI